MKSTLTCLLAALALSGCAGGIGEWSHGDWLDRVGMEPAQAIVHTPAEQEQLQAQADRLRAEGEALRRSMALEKSRVKRVLALQRLEEIGDELRPVELALRGGPMPPQIRLEPAPAASGA